jgi:voltage-gated potassium channel
VVVYSVEYVLRLWSCTSDPATAHPLRGRLAVAGRPMQIVDLLAILPFYLQLLIPGLDLRFVRALRLFRIFRVFRAGRLAEAVVILAAVVRNRKNELLASFLVIVIIVVLAGNLMYLLEHHAQSDAFSSVPAAMWWAVITVTTIGYGDLFPITALGRLVGSMLALVGIVMLALPVGVLGSGFLEEIERRRKAAAGAAGDVCPHCGRPRE